MAWCVLDQVLLPFLSEPPILMKALQPILALWPALLLAASSHAQVEFGLQFLPSSGSYTVTARSQADFLPPSANIILNGQATLVVPSGAFELGSIQGHVGNWQLTNLLVSPSENPGMDYAVFTLVGATNAGVFEAGQAVALFSFSNKKGCTGAIGLMDTATDPFSPPNSLGAQVGHKLVLEGVGGDAYLGNFGTPAADCFDSPNCLISVGLQFQPDGTYLVSLHPDVNFQQPSPLKYVQITIKLPTGSFQLHNLQAVQASDLPITETTRFDHPNGAPGFDYVHFTLEAAGQGVVLLPGTNVPLLKFGNAGSCQGDSVFLVKKGDPFLPPNSLSANIGLSVKFVGDDAAIPVCPALNASAAPCIGCLFANNVLSIDSVVTANPSSCLGGADGMVKIYAQGPPLMEFSVNAGLTWSADNHFGGLQAGTYVPMVRSNHFGCPVQLTGSPVQLLPGSEVDLVLDVPQQVCEKNDVVLKIASPNNLPSGTAYQWTGPTGFTADIADPIILDTKTYHSGNYTLMVQVPGCNPASATAAMSVGALPEAPSILANGPLCAGEKLAVSTDASATKFEWLSPAGQNATTLALPGLTTSQNSTLIPPGHPAYLSGDWRVRVTAPNGCSATSPATSVQIKPRPQAFAETAGPVCPGEAAQLLSNPLPGASYVWKELGNGAVYSMQPNPLVPNMTVANAYELLVTQDGCVSQNPAYTVINIKPLPQFVPFYDYEVAADCAPRSIQFVVSTFDSDLTYEWTGPNGFYSQNEYPVIVNATSEANGSYLLKATNSYGCSSGVTLEITEVVDPQPKPVLQSTGFACLGEEVQLSTQVYSGSQVSYKWYKNNTVLPGQNANSLNISALQAVDVGSYRVEVQVDGCSLASETMPVNLLPSPNPQPSFLLGDPCEGGTLQFFSSTSNIASWEWAGPNGFYSDSPTPLIYNTEFDDVGAYTITATGTNGCKATASVVVDGILPVPDVPQVVSNSPVCPAGDITLTVQNPVFGGTVSYDWVNGQGDYLGSTASVLSLSTSDPLAVQPFLVRAVLNTCPSDFSAPTNVEVLPIPAALAWNGGSICEGEVAQLFASTVPNGSYEWRLAGQPQVFSYEQNPVLPLSDSTDFQVVIKANGCPEAATAYTSVSVNPKPVIGGLTGGGTYCAGSAVSLSAENNVPLDGPVQYSWTGPNGFVSTNSGAANGPFFLNFGAIGVQNEGAYQLTLQSSAGCVSDPQSVMVEVGEMPQPPVLSIPDAVLCQSETLVLNASPAQGTTVGYDWYFNNGTGDFLMATTTSPTYLLPAVMPSNTGTYFVKTTADGCTAPPSNLGNVTVLGVATVVSAANPTTALTPACEGSPVQLDATLIPGADYLWYGPAGFFDEVPNPLIGAVGENGGGSYLLIVSLPECDLAMTASTEVFVQPMPAMPDLTGDAEACEGTATLLSVANAEAGASYFFYFGENAQPLGEGTAGQLLLENTGAAQAGGYFAQAELNGCLSAVSEVFQLQVVPAQTDLAFAGPDQVVCGASELPKLEAVQPLIGTGRWTSLDGATVVQPSLANSVVTGLLPGLNRFAWTLSNGHCANGGSDTVVVRFEQMQAVADAFSLPLNDTLAVNLLDNDSIGTVEALDFFILKKPSKGSLLEDGSGNVVYTPYPNAFGEDDFRYRICSMACPESCDDAVVRIRFDGTVAARDCFIPNLITPDGDGLDDTFIVPCASGWPGSRLVVFNRWGSMVFESDDYQNDWDGTYKNAGLTPGTYFYQLTLNDGLRTMLQGYVVVKMEK